MRLGSEFQQRIDALQQLGSMVEKLKKEQERTWIEKVNHGSYKQKNIQSNGFIYTKAINEWIELRLSSHLEGYAAAIMEKELNTKESMKKCTDEYSIRNA